MKKILIAVLMLAGVAAFIAGIIMHRPEVLDNLKIRATMERLQSYLPFEIKKTGSRSEQVEPEETSEREPEESKHYTYTDEQVQQAMREVLENKRKEQALGSKKAKSVLEVEPVPVKPKQVGEQKYIYRIKLHSGAVIYTERVQKDNGTIRYVDSHGLEISIGPDQVQEIKKIRVQRAETASEKSDE